jgi:hypothetical protein
MVPPVTEECLFPVLRDLCRHNVDPEGDSKLVRDIASSLRAFVASDHMNNPTGSKHWFENYIQFLKRKLTISHLEPELPTIRTSQSHSWQDQQPTDDLPLSVHNTLYSLFRQCSQNGSDCPGSESWHQGKLSLRENIEIEDGDAIFDAVFSRTPVDMDSNDHVQWQQVQFRIRYDSIIMELHIITHPKGYLNQANIFLFLIHSTKRVAFDLPSSVSTCEEATSRSVEKMPSLDEFCRMLEPNDSGPKKLCFPPRLGRTLLPADDFIANQPSISLTDILQHPALLTRHRLHLAYIIAKSF